MEIITRGHVVEDNSNMHTQANIAFPRIHRLVCLPVVDSGVTVTGGYPGILGLAVAVLSL